MFVQNVGQLGKDVYSQSIGEDTRVSLSSEGVWITLVQRGHSDPATRQKSETSVASDIQYGAPSQRGVSLRLSFLNTTPLSAPEPFDLLQTRVSYFIGKDPAGWRASVPVWGGLRIRELYPGIDLEITGREGYFGWQLVLQPGSDLALVRLKIDGAEGMDLNGDSLRLITAIGEYEIPLIGLDASGHSVSARPEVTGNTVSFPFARSHVGPGIETITSQEARSLIYSTFLGGAGDDQATELAIDANGAAYLVGRTTSLDFPTTPGAFDPSSGGSWDGFVAKLDPSGSRLVYATFLGGSGEEALIHATVDNAGAVYATGRTSSADFPATSTAYDATFNGGRFDGFVTKLSASGTELLYSTFLGGNGDDESEHVFVNETGTAYLTGQTSSGGFPTTTGAFSRNLMGTYDAFVSRLNATGSVLVFSTLLGGSCSGVDGGFGIAADSDGYVYVGGVTHCPDFPATRGSFGGGAYDAFLAKLTPAGERLIFAIFLGGSAGDNINDLAVDTSRNIYVAGYTESYDFPVTAGTYRGGGNDALVAKVKPDGTGVIYTEFIGGSGRDWAYDIAISRNGAAYITGETDSRDLPTTSGALATSFRGGTSDAYLVALNGDGSRVTYASYLGSIGMDWGHGIAVSSDGAVAVTGKAWSDFPTTPGAFDTSYNGGDDVFLLKLAGVGVERPPANSGFVTGGGWINSPRGAYIQNPTITGKANFGFSAKYHNGTATPEGQIEFQLHSANLNFHSIKLERLDVIGARAQFRGSGTINGTGEYRFLVTTVDGQATQKTGSDLFRIKIWDNGMAGVIYDSQPGTPEDAIPSTAISGGSIVIRK